MEKRYSVIFTGKIIEGFSEDAVRENLIRIYGKRGDDQMLNAFFSGKNIILLKNLSYEEADKGIDRFEGAGLDCVAVIVESQPEYSPDETYNLIFTGVFIEGLDKDQIRDNINNIYGKRNGDQVIDNFFKGSEIILMKNLNHKSVNINLARFEQAGLKCIIKTVKDIKDLSSIEMDGLNENKSESVKIRIFDDKKKITTNNFIEKNKDISNKKEEPLPNGFFRASKKLAEEQFCRNCNGNFSEGQAVIKCEKCGYYYDKLCWEKNKGCSARECENYAGPRTEQKTETKKTFNLVMGKDAEDIKAAVVAGIISGGITLIVTLIAIFRKEDLFGLGFSIYNVLDVLLIFGLTFGIYKKSRSCALAMLIYFLVSKIYIIYQTGKFQGGFLAVLFIYFFYRGVRGTFNYHQAAKS
ncbi:MAG: hypothetical protein HQK91_02965 [Nitrospirae bacterium]|nr:hypothetical protein [Nitrospirota bacterium]